MKTPEGEGVGACSFVHNISRVDGCVGAPGWELGKLTSKSIIETDLVSA